MILFHVLIEHIHTAGCKIAQTFALKSSVSSTMLRISDVNGFSYQHCPVGLFINLGTYFLPAVMASFLIRQPLIFSTILVVDKQACIILPRNGIACLTLTKSSLVSVITQQCGRGHFSQPQSTLLNNFNSFEIKTEIDYSDTRHS